MPYDRTRRDRESQIRDFTEADYTEVEMRAILADRRENARQQGDTIPTTVEVSRRSTREAPEFVFRTIDGYEIRQGSLILGRALSESRHEIRQIGRDRFLGRALSESRVYESPTGRSSQREMPVMRNIEQPEPAKAPERTLYDWLKM